MGAGTRRAGNMKNGETMKNDARKMALENQIELAQQNAIDFTHACMTIALHDAVSYTHLTLPTIA